MAYLPSVSSPVARRQEAVEITDDGDGAAFVGFAEDWWVVHGHRGSFSRV